MSLMKVSDVAKKLNLTPQTIYRLVKNNELPHIRLGRMILFNEETLNNYLHKLEEKTKKEVS